MRQSSSGRVFIMDNSAQMRPHLWLIRYFLKFYYYAYRFILFLFISIRVLLYGLFHPSVIFNFSFGVVTEIAEFHKRCGGVVRNFKGSKVYQDMTGALCFAKSNCLNAGFGTIRPIEAQVLAALVMHLKPGTIFEIGTYTGFSTLHLARNSPFDATIYTLDLPYDKTEITLRNDLNEAHRDIKNINLNEKRYFHADEERKKIVELFGDSMTFDFSPYFGKMDFIFIDANHSHAYVKSDTENALKMLSDRGVILWHDYDFIHPGVFKVINEAAKTKRIYYIERTRYALFINREAQI
jgi:predicted O-methyltransferase YrrM